MSGPGPLSQFLKICQLLRQRVVDDRPDFANRETFSRRAGRRSWVHRQFFLGRLSGALENGRETVYIVIVTRGPRPAITTC